MGIDERKIDRGARHRVRRLGLTAGPAAWRSALVVSARMHSGVSRGWFGPYGAAGATFLLSSATACAPESPRDQALALEATQGESVADSPLDGGTTTLGGTRGGTSSGPHSHSSDGDLAGAPPPVQPIVEGFALSVSKLVNGQLKVLWEALLKAGYPFP